MNHRFLGATGTKVSELCFGTQTFGWGADERAAHDMADRFVEEGGNFFDTSDKYNDGESERILGSWLQGRHRDDVVIASKVFFDVGDGPNDMGASRKRILAQADASLKRLGTDYLDLYQVHCWDASTPLEETLAALDTLVRQGKVRYVGVSNFAPSHLMKALMSARIHGFEPVRSLQPEYSLLVRSPEWELIPLCRAEGVAVLPWSPLGGGWLTGKYRRDAPPPADSRVGRADRWDDQPEQRETERTWRVLEVLEAVAAERERTVAQVALAWLLAKPGVTAPIFGARTVAQLEQNLGAVGWTLAQQEIDRLDEVSAVPLPSPYAFIERYTRRRDENAMYALR
ncbi:MAG TPA: aldo/keto reductase [Longimicrobiales bacterium]|nr:aldo/keto reductase [Longimicrobiales bacterium]